MTVVSYKVSAKEPYSTDVEKKDILFEFPLPYIKKFRSRSPREKNCPYLKLHTYVHKQLKRKAQVDPTTVVTCISQLILHKKTAEELNAAVIDWIPIECRYAKFGSKWHANQYGMWRMDCGPNMSTSPAIKPGRIYVVK